VRAEKVFVHLPALVGRRREALREQVFFVLAQPLNVSDFSEHAGDFFSIFRSYRCAARASSIKKPKIANAKEFCD
jgi:hypothetical protein